MRGARLPAQPVPSPSGQLLLPFAVPCSVSPFAFRPRPRRGSGNGVDEPGPVDGGRSSRREVRGNHRLRAASCPAPGEERAPEPGVESSGAARPSFQKAGNELTEFQEGSRELEAELQEKLVQAEERNRHLQADNQTEIRSGSIQGSPLGWPPLERLQAHLCVPCSCPAAHSSSLNLELVSQTTLQCILNI
ncbi:oocyte-expressed protein homolog isoform X2 [Lagenorhynchus albirostris]|uniref:oocyte-expressed protein homolog isoform X2 n=1 Tax=Lagenorhynchus albirostris TaxID=27610 RepID=UPI0028EE916A|nr:oocyte-expressed protein homolog isoform X2 [Lagenorhynchus albirostris]